MAARASPATASTRGWLTPPSARLRSTLRPWHLPAPPLALQVGNQHLEPRLVRPVDELLLAQAAPPLRRLALELVLLPAARPHQLARRRALQPLARAALRL